MEKLGHQPWRVSITEPMFEHTAFGRRRAEFRALDWSVQNEMIRDHERLMREVNEPRPMPRRSARLAELKNKASETEGVASTKPDGNSSTGKQKTPNTVPKKTVPAKKSSIKQ